MAERVACLPALKKTNWPDWHNAAGVAVHPRTPHRGCQLAGGGGGGGLAHPRCLPCLCLLEGAPCGKGHTCEAMEMRC